jgi:hypothetical protein
VIVWVSRRRVEVRVGSFAIVRVRNWGTTGRITSHVSIVRRKRHAVVRRTDASSPVIVRWFVKRLNVDGLIEEKDFRFVLLGVMRVVGAFERNVSDAFIGFRYDSNGAVAESPEFFGQRVFHSFVADFVVDVRY